MTIRMCVSFLRRPLRTPFVFGCGETAPGVMQFGGDANAMRGMTPMILPDQNPNRTAPQRIFIRNADRLSARPIRCPKS